MGSPSKMAVFDSCRLSGPLRQTTLPRPKWKPSATLADSKNTASWMFDARKLQGSSDAFDQPLVVEPFANLVGGYSSTGRVLWVYEDVEFLGDNH